MQRSNIWYLNSTESHVCFLSAVWIINYNIEQVCGKIFYFFRYCGSIKKLLSSHSPTASYSRNRAKGPGVQFNFACESSAQPPGAYSLTFSHICSWFFYFFYFFYSTPPPPHTPSPRWTADLLLRAASSWKAQLDWSEHICLSPADKKLYSATLNNFLGTEPVILRNLGQQHYSMKSEYLPAWLYGTWSRERRLSRTLPNGRFIKSSLTRLQFSPGMLFFSIKRKWIKRTTQHGAQLPLFGTNCALESKL